MKTIPIINCQAFSFSDKLSKERIDRALAAFGTIVIRRLLCFALYLLGVNRQDLAKALDLPAETVKSIIKVLMADGLRALEDRRRKPSVVISRVCPTLSPIALKQIGSDVIVDFGAQDRQIRIDRNDTLQLRTILLTMLNSGLLADQQVAEAIGLTIQRTTALAQGLMQSGALSLVDRREGQKQDYRVTPEIKAELIQQFALDVITGGPVSGESISGRLKERCEIAIPARTVRYHLGKLGLPGIKHSLPRLVAAVKKTSKNGV